MDIELQKIDSWNLIEHKKLKRFLEMVPGLLTWSALTLPIFFSFYLPASVAYFIIAFDIFWLFRAIYMARNLIYSYRRLSIDQSIDWLSRLKSTEDIDNLKKEFHSRIYSFEKKVLFKKPFIWLFKYFPGIRKAVFNLEYLQTSINEIKGLNQANILNYNNLYQLVILATYKEDFEIIKQSIDAIINSDYPSDKIIFVLATEERDKENALVIAKKLEDLFKDKFAYFLTTVHPKDIEGEMIGKGGNISHAGREVKKIIDEKGIDYENIITTTLDADNKVHPEYFACLSYNYVINQRRTRRSYQPIPIFNNNIWDVPAPARIIATGNSFWQLMEATRPERLRNFSSHAQSFRTLVDTDFWSVTSIVEDGHQFWRTYFTYNGDHQVIPIFLPIYQDAVLGKNYVATLKAQYIQLRRWAWGASDLAYVGVNFYNNKKIHFSRKLISLYRLMEGYFFWATAPLFITFVAWLPGLLNPGFKYTALAHNLPIVTSRILTVSTIGLVTIIIISNLMLPKRPKRYKKFKHVGMVLQWILLPIITIFISSIPAIDAQTRLMLGKQLGWQVTKKVRKE